MAPHHRPRFQRPAPASALPVTSLPTSIDWRDYDIVSAVKDQGHVSLHQSYFCLYVT